MLLDNSGLLKMVLKSKHHIIHPGLSDTVNLEAASNAQVFSWPIAQR